MQDTRSGILLAVIGFATLSVGDAVLKSMAGDWPVTAVAALRFTIGAVALSVLLGLNEGRAGFHPNKPWLQVARGLCLAGASLAFFSAIFVMPLAETMAITFLSPVLTAVLSGPLLGEKVTRAVWAACIAALVGVALILRPNLAEIGWPAILPLISAVFFSLMIIANRASAGTGTALAMQTYMAVIAAPILIAATIVGELSAIEELSISWPQFDVVLRCAFVALTATTAHWLVYLGTMRAGASQVAPASYVQMLVATILGWWFFGDVPDAITLIGACIIIGAGIFLWHQSTREKEMA
ncbi:MAG: DMT family transporter [Altererythrobacter sp.]|nr:DMT family transporter [Altererythrobacter sp.]NNF95164.1 DMT family transporter [Altererythrobacter sp.]